MAIRRLRSQEPPAPAPSLERQPSAADLDAVAEEQKAKEATAPKVMADPRLSTPAATPKTVEQPSARGVAPDVAMASPSFLMAHPGVDWSDPKQDTDKNDSRGSEKLDPYQPGPKGESLPADALTDVQRQRIADKREARLGENMANTAMVDSIGNTKGAFKVTPGGKGQHGEQLPHTVDYSEPVEPAPVHVGPRGKGAPADSFHGVRAVKK